MNLEKRTNIKFVDQKKLKIHTRSTKLISAEPINLEAKIFEVRKRKAAILDKIPVQSAAMILSSAKLHFIDFVSDLAEYMDPKAFRIIYMGKNIIYMTFLYLKYFLDTDSIFLAMSKESLSELVIDEVASGWELPELYWFVEHPESKKPGKFEFFKKIFLSYI